MIKTECSKKRNVNKKEIVIYIINQRQKWNRNCKTKNIKTIFLNCIFQNKFGLQNMLLKLVVLDL